MEPKTSGYRVLKGQEPKTMNHSKQQTSKSKVLNDPKPYYKAKAQNKKRPIRTNTKGPIKVWVPKNEIIFVADLLKNKAMAPVLGQWMLTTYNKKMPIFEILTLKEEISVKSGRNQ